MQHPSSLFPHNGGLDYPPPSAAHSGYPASSALHHGAHPHESYSDQDIELVHQIVSLAESLYPTLPERERLPTNALFLAAEQLLPEHGYDPEDPPSHISRLIFKIGGQRAGDTLSDKFKSVLGGMGIKLEFVPSSNPSSRPGSRASIAPSDAIPAQPESRASSSLSDRGILDGILRQPPIRDSHNSPPVVDIRFQTLGDDLADLEDRENLLRDFRMQQDRELVGDVFSTWRATARQAKRNNDELRTHAVEFDNNDLLGEVLDIWNEEAALARQQRLEAEAAAKHEAYVAKMERRATRVYEIFTIRNVLALWQDQAQEEIDRTAVARRHLVRKRTFEGWHAQHVEDETKVKNFILGNALQKWSQVALHHEVRHEVAAQWHQQQLCNVTLNQMLEETKKRIADEFYAVNLAKQSLDTWADKARDLNEEYQVAVALDERLVLDEAVNIWLEELEVQQYDAYECTRQFLVLGCRRDLEYWQEQARLSVLLKQYNAKRAHDTRRQVMETWHGNLQNVKGNTMVADAFFLEEPVEHWEREMKLKLFIERDEYEIKAAVLSQWALEEKLAWYKRYLDTRTKRETFNTLFKAARQARDDRVRYEEEADYVDSYYTQTDALETWIFETDKMYRHHHNANVVNLYWTTRPCIDHWREQCHQSQARDTYYKRKANKHRAISMVLGVLDEWPDIAETTRRQRMVSSLRQFRRKYKIALAQECLGKWLDATADALDVGHDAHRTNLHYKWEDLNDCIDYWSLMTKRAQNIQQIAADAELEVYYGKWQAQLYETKENMADAIDYDTEKTRKSCWERWEFQAIQNESKRHMANTLREKNERRLCHQLLEDWQQKAVPEAAARFDPRFSTLSARRSVRQSTRQQLARSSTAGFYTASQLATLPFRSLGPMPEFDEEPLLPDAEVDDPGFMSTPTRRTGSARPLGYRPTTTPSAILPSPYERELRRRYGGPRPDFVNITEESGELEF
ncbi:Sfi1 spindle body protein-domain-containing protein [Chaetomium strumarium]|uniref:Sfi1 spindle body protein-domain-containing protein n=1 Tax=Chaetomium strumarium TaxID=1170767 RepID=A0AAJ0GQD2_9PEZI|nr:Sfi1 spindle body protein-domain-containing protein [Chaetomium strumarium]